MAKVSNQQLKSVGVGRHGVGDGVYLVVSKSGRRTWVLRYQASGKRHDLGLGSYPTVGLTEARRAAFEAKKLVHQGEDPIEARRATRMASRGIPTFEDIAKIVIPQKQAESVNDKVKYQIQHYLGPAYCAKILNRPVNSITPLDVAEVLSPIWDTKPEVARKLLPLIRKVFDRARVILRVDHQIEMVRNPADKSDLWALNLGAPKRLTRGRHPALHYSEIANFLSELRRVNTVGSKALELLILTVVRTDAVLKAKWVDFDLENAIWTVPLENLKDRKHRDNGFRVPLSGSALKLLKDMNDKKTSRFLFPGQKDQDPISNMTLAMTVRRMNGPDSPKWVDKTSNRPIVPHGFRSSFRVWAEEQTSTPHLIVEEAMGHQVGTPVERSYRRTDNLEKRRPLMEAWASYCEFLNQKNVVYLPSRAT